MIDFSKVDKWSLGYHLGRYVFLYPFYRAYYRNIEVVNKEAIPYDRPVIFALNHQNALMDALPFVFLTKPQVVFLARADIFRKTMVAKILRAIKIMPVFRIRDGAENLAKNDSTFLTAAQILQRRNKLGMMPEGNHGDKRQLRPLNKGIFRIAMKAQEAFGDKPGVVIIPVGFEFDHYQKFRGTILMHFGDPIEVHEYYNEYTQNTAHCFNLMRNRLREGMSRIMINIKTNGHYHTFEQVRRIYRPQMCQTLKLRKKRLYHRFLADQETLKILDKGLEKDEATINKLEETTTAYLQGLQKLNLRDWVFAREKFTIAGLLMEGLLLLTLLPFHLAGMIANYIPYKLPSLFLKKIKDPQFVSSFAFVLGIIFFYLYYLLVILPLVLIFVPVWWGKLAALVGLPLLGVLAIEYYFKLRKYRAKWNYLILTLSNHKLLNKVKQLRNGIIKTMDELKTKHHEV